MYSKFVFNDLTFSELLLSIFPKYSRTRTEKSAPFNDTCVKFIALFRKLVIVFLGRNTRNNKFLDVTIKDTKKLTWHCC